MNTLLKSIFFCLLCWSCLHSQTIDILTRWNLKDIYKQDWPLIRQAGYEVRIFHLYPGDERAQVHKYLKRHYSKDTKKIIVMEDFISKTALTSIDKSRWAVFIWEPIGASAGCSYYSSVYTFNDDLVGHKNYRKFNYPNLIPPVSNTVPFNKKKLCAAVISHWLPEREAIVNFFKNNHPEAFDLYGINPGPYSTSSIYKGPIPGHHSDPPKLENLAHYKFVLAFENSAAPGVQSGYWAPGYITEKIFCAFAAGTVPIYLGPDNVDHYIPKNCFISYKDFSSPKELYRHLVNMPEETYEWYRKNIKEYLQSDQAQIFSQTAFEKTILEAARS